MPTLKKNAFFSMLILSALALADQHARETRNATNPRQILSCEEERDSLKAQINQSAFTCAANCSYWVNGFAGKIVKGYETTLVISKAATKEQAFQKLDDLCQSYAKAHDGQKAGLGIGSGSNTTLYDKKSMNSFCK
jgi:hypothetical protein